MRSKARAAERERERERRVCFCGWVGGAPVVVVEAGVLYFSRSSDVEREKERLCLRGRAFLC